VSVRVWLGQQGARSRRWSFRRSQPLAGVEVVRAYSIAIGVAEVLGAVGWVIPGAVLDAALVPILLGHFMWREGTAHRRLLPVLALIAMLRVLSIAAAVPRLPVVTWYVTVGGALLIGEVLTIRLVEEPWERLNLALRRPRLDLAIAATGIPAGFIGYLLLRPGPLMPGAGPAQMIAGIVGLVVFAAFAEELLFRGLLQSIAIETFGIWRLGLVYAATMSGVMYLGSGSLPYTIAVAAYGLLLGATILRGGSVWGTTASHGLALIGMAFVWPILLGSA
jgi:membrane protease YdiL (CAAX protease family)